jgi:transketolase
VGLGLALKKKLKGEDGKVFVVVGDGEMEEGMVWEALQVAQHHNVSNLDILIDRNGLSSDYRPLGHYSLFDRCEAFCKYTYSIDGHYLGSLKCIHSGELPEIGGLRILICNTVKGKGVSWMESEACWHGSVELTDDQFLSAYNEILHSGDMGPSPEVTLEDFET